MAPSSGTLERHRPSLDGAIAHAAAGNEMRVAELEIVARETKEGLEGDRVELQQEKKVESVVLDDALKNDVSVAMENAVLLKVNNEGFAQPGIWMSHPNASLPSKTRLCHRCRGLKIAYTPSPLLVKVSEETVSLRNPPTYILFDGDPTNGDLPPYVPLPRIA
ncbi:hypothetical protein BKA70DRAFT_1419444 [Coprinopsis sp. MPI-PUGE-AT-0042]|nr:hypothetical protein BKA70DRAFT_1419444 [Coprinopsis sp. MPI-PUGE-AT-0042]